MGKASPLTSDEYTSRLLIAISPRLNMKDNHSEAERALNKILNYRLQSEAYEQTGIKQGWKEAKFLPPSYALRYVLSVAENYFKSNTVS
jgi:hypothetical protein